MSPNSSLGQQISTAIGSLMEVCDCQRFALSATTSFIHPTHYNVVDAGCRCLPQDDLLRCDPSSFCGFGKQYEEEAPCTEC